MNDEITFQMGSYEEIIPPPLLGDLTPEEAWQKYSAFAESVGAPVDGPQNESEKPYWYNLAAAFCHQMRLREVIAGTAQNETPEEKALRLLVQQGCPMSLRPLGMEDKDPETFAPVLTRLTDTDWRIGMPDNGRTVVFTTPLDKAVEIAQKLYAEWRNEEKQNR